MVKFDDDQEQELDLDVVAPVAKRFQATENIDKTHLKILVSSWIKSLSKEINNVGS